jgi:hypothetical protein
LNKTKTSRMKEVISRHEYAGGGYASILSGPDVANKVKV